MLLVGETQLINSDSNLAAVSCISIAAVVPKRACRFTFIQNKEEFNLTYIQCWMCLIAASRKYSMARYLRT